MYIKGIIEAKLFINRYKYSINVHSYDLLMLSLYQELINFLNRPNEQINLISGINLINNFMSNNNINENININNLWRMIAPPGPLSTQQLELLGQAASILRNKLYLLPILFNSYNSLMYLQEYVNTYFRNINATTELILQIAINFMNQANENITTAEIEQYIRNYLITNGVSLPNSPNLIQSSSPSPVSSSPVSSSASPASEEAIFYNTRNNFSNLLQSKSNYIKGILYSLHYITTYNYSTFNESEPYSLGTSYFQMLTNFMNRPEEQININSGVTMLNNFMSNNNINENININRLWDKTGFPDTMTSELNVLFGQAASLLRNKLYLFLIMNDTIARLMYLASYLNNYLSSITSPTQVILQIAIDFLNQANQNTTPADVEIYARNYLISNGVSLPNSPNTQLAPGPSSALPYNSSMSLEPVSVGYNPSISPEPSPSPEVATVAYNSGISPEAEPLSEPVSESGLIGGSKTRRYKKHKKTRRAKDKISKRCTKYANKANQD
jgi:hypothetical protein